MPTRNSKSDRSPNEGAGGERSDADMLARLGLGADDLSPAARARLAVLWDELHALTRALDASRRRIAELEALADIDPLVPVLNRRAFLRELMRVMSFAERYEAPASLLYFDLDNLKAVNDRFGHDSGDAALRHVAGVLTANVRASDAVGRLGGDEFGIILARADHAQAVQKGDRLAELIERTPLVWAEQKVKLGASYGAYTFRRGEDPDRAIASADQSMYKQKSARKNAVSPSIRR